MKRILKAFQILVILQLFNPSAGLASDEPESLPSGFARPSWLVRAVQAVVKLGYELAKYARTAAPLANLTAGTLEHVANQLKAIEKMKNALLNEMEKAGFPSMGK
jgi:hypothetical protein